MRLSDVLIDGMENGWLVRNNYEIPQEILNAIDENSKKVAEKYNKMVKIIQECRECVEKTCYWEKLLEALKLWQELEHELPQLFLEDIVRILERNRIIVRYNRCVSVAIAASRFRRYFTFTEILREIKFTKSFSGVREISINKILSRVLKYLESSGLLIKTWRISKLKADVVYFRLFRIRSGETAKECKHCWLIRELRRILEIAEKL